MFSRRSRSNSADLLNDPNGLLPPAQHVEEYLKDYSKEHALFVVDHDMEMNAYVSNAISETEMGAGIVISHVEKTEVMNEEFFEEHEVEEMKEIEDIFEEQVPDEHVEGIYKDEVEHVDLKSIKDALTNVYEFYNDAEIMETMLENAFGAADETFGADGELEEPEEQLTLAELTSEVTFNPDADSIPQAVKDVFKKYGCKSLKTGGPIAIKELAAAYILETEVDDSFYIFDIGNVQRLYDAWHCAMPRVTPFYAVKCSPMAAVIDCLAANGCGFDCASAAEIQLVMDSGVGVDRIIFAHPAKRPHDIRFAAEKNVKLTTFDSVIELEKIAKWHPASDCVMRIRADDPNAGISFGIKYGANPDEYDLLLKAAVDLGLNVAGVSFHVGSLAKSGAAFYAAIKQARVAFDCAKKYGFQFRLLDIGGGFTGRFNSNGVVQSMVGDIPANINEALDEFFGETTPYHHIQVIAEPGRYFAEASMHLLCHIHSVRNRADFCDYLISDGLYGSFNCVVYDGAKPRAWLLPGPSLPPLEDTTMQRSTIFGPTCDSMDGVFKDVMLPQLRVGDWLLFPHFGAYTLAGATNFNGIQSACPTILYIESGSSVDEEESLIMWACELSKPPSAIVAA